MEFNPLTFVLLLLNTLFFNPIFKILISKKRKLRIESIKTIQKNSIECVLNISYLIAIKQKLSLKFFYFRILSKNLR
jgi:hypothetical protein